MVIAYGWHLQELPVLRALDRKNGELFYFVSSQDRTG